MTGKHPEPIDDSLNGTADRRQSDLGALRRTDELLDALSERRAACCDAEGDPAFALLKALIDDVDAGAPPLSPADRQSRAGRSPRRLSRTLVSLCVATTVLMTTGVAAAGGVLTPFAPTPSRSDPHIQDRGELPAALDVVSKDEGGWSGRHRPPRWRRHDKGPHVAVQTGEQTGEQTSEQVVGGASAGSPTPTPPQATPTPQVTPYETDVQPADQPDPTPTPTPTPTPGSGSTLGSESGSDGSVQPKMAPLDAPGQGLDQPDGTGQEPAVPVQ